MIDFSTPLQGMHQAEDRLNLAANRIAQMPSTASAPSPVDNVDLSEEAVAMLDSRNHFAANVKVVQAGDEMTKAVLDMLG